jgi:hypothetical protein
MTPITSPVPRSLDTVGVVPLIPLAIVGSGAIVSYFLGAKAIDNLTSRPIDPATGKPLPDPNLQALQNTALLAAVALGGIWIWSNSPKK